MAGKGQPKGFVGNPSGKNQYVLKKGAGQKTEHIGINIVPNLKQAIQAEVNTRKECGEKVTVTDWLEEAIREKLEKSLDRK
ncbi:hypothetical protein FRE64_16720 (plasmid) [Euhalothece natronophila Z-M001]|uniref:Uncharacterized protein n=1 Tax=Euhalothece natronophila Z-M001 TaxID=522448 RepID=A0A5B8NTF8_9CHRO|nr:hypothetical protein [Euhalothece natronophila]QDZ41615.1 hypothetical protein FRE64_16720 [Euhalothece natronophila Z-M001]